ncbi:MAG TPA: hypothetical protein VE567_09150, partial [Sphingomonas sp.]|nr:hypothetical protein [Sphingomonas sp.]
VSIGIAESGARLTIEKGARLDMGARRTQAAEAAGLPGARLIAETVKAPGTLADTTAYRLVEADSGGLLTLRAPLVGGGANMVDISIGAPTSISGAREVQIEAFRRYDLDQMINSMSVPGLDYNSDGSGLQLDPTANFQARDENNQPTPYAGNFLSADFVTEEGFRSIPNFIRTFRASASDGTSFEGYRVRPGVELVTTQSLSLVSQWNLAAADIDFEGAFAAGVVEKLDKLGHRLTSYGLTQAGDAYYSVVAGREGELLDRFANFYYRVDGSARGEAPVLRFRTGGNLRIERTINDGFFVFRDRSDQAYVDYQLGGGVRHYMPAFQLACGVVADGNCSGLATFGDNVPNSERSARSVRVNIDNVLRGLPLDTVGVPAPLAPEANSPAALGTQADPLTGDFVGAPLEFGELFPLLPGNVAMRSSDISLVGGATIGNGYSANPDYTFASSKADVVVTDARAEADGSETRWSYRLQASPAVPVIAGDQLVFRFFKQQDGQPIFFDLNDFLNQDRGGTDYGIDELTANTYAVLNWGAAGSDGSNPAIAPAQAFFAPLGRTFLGSAKRPTGVVAPLGEVLRFLEGYEADYLRDLYAGLFKQQLSNPLGPISFDPTARAQVQTVVRTGAGRISTIAARDADLRDGTQAVYRTNDGTLVPRNAGGPSPEQQQVGGTSIYSAGRRIAQEAIQARLPNGQVTRVDLTSGFFNSG